LGGDEQQLAHPNVTTKTERRHHCPWCGGDDYDALTWGVIGPQAMVWAKTAGRHDQRKKTVSGETEVENRGAKYRGVRYIFYVAILKINLRFRTRIKLGW